MAKSANNLKKLISDGLKGPFESSSFKLGYGSFIKGNVRPGYDVIIGNGTYIISENSRIILEDGVRIWNCTKIKERDDLQEIKIRRGSRIGSHVTIEGKVDIGENVKIGNAVLLGRNISIGDECKLEDKVTIVKNAQIGKRNRFYNCTISSAPQAFRDIGTGKVIIGDDNTFREYVVVNRGSVAGGGKTTIGNGNQILSHVHIAHDCIIGNCNEIVSLAGLAGHVNVGDYVRISGMVGIAQWVHIGDGAFVAGQSGVNDNVLPYSRVGGSPASLRGINFERLKRFYGAEWREAYNELKNIYKFIHNKKYCDRDLTYLFRRSVSKPAKKIAEFVENLSPKNKEILRFEEARR